jgi:hypothetical protein
VKERPDRQFTAASKSKFAAHCCVENEQAKCVQLHYFVSTEKRSVPAWKFGETDGPSALLACSELSGRTRPHGDTNGRKRKPVRAGSGDRAREVDNRVYTTEQSRQSVSSLPFGYLHLRPSYRPDFAPGGDAQQLLR